MMYIIRFFEKSNRKRGCITSDSDTREIKDIIDENKVRHAIEEFFALAVNILNNGIKEVTFSVSDYNNKCIWSGEGVVVEDKLKICALKNEKIVER